MITSYQQREPANSSSLGQVFEKGKEIVLEIARNPRPAGRWWAVSDK